MLVSYTPEWDVREDVQVRMGVDVTKASGEQMAILQGIFRTGWGGVSLLLFACS